MPAPEINVINLTEGGSHIEENETRIEVLETRSDGLDVWVDEVVASGTTVQHLGLSSPPPRSALAPFAAPVMAVAPTVDEGTSNGATGIASGTDIIWTDSLFRYIGATPTARDVFGTTFAHVESWGQAYPSQTTWSSEFQYYGEEFEILCGSEAPAQWRLWVDEELESATAHSQTSGQDLWRKLITFPTVGMRHIRVEMSQEFSFRGIRIGATDAIFPPHLPLGPLVMPIGDSITGGTSGTSSYMHGPYSEVCRLLGWRNVRFNAQGGTGFLNPSNSGKQKVRDRLAAMVFPYEPDIVILAAGINDVTYDDGGGTVSTAEVAAEAATTCAAIKTELPDCTLIVVLPSFIRESDIFSTASYAAAIKAAIVSYSDLTIDPWLDGWFTGDGKVGTTDGAGSSDIFCSSDGIHPTDAGALYIGRRVAAEINAAMPILGI